MQRFALSLCLLWLGAVQAAGIDHLHRFLDGLDTLEAEFDQRVTNSDHSQDVRSHGTLYLARPGRFRWAYDQPDAQLIVADGDRVWLYDPELEQVSHQAQADALKGTPALLLSDRRPVETHFRVFDAGHRQGLDWVRLRPRDKDAVVHDLLLGFAGDRLVRLEMRDEFGQRTTFVFRDIKRNPRLDAALFRFDPPPEVDILER